MKGVHIRKIKVVHEDERRKILEIMNGELTIKNMKILEVKKGEQLLGNHYHHYAELLYMYKGSARYKMRNIITKEEEEIELTEGDVMFRAPYITHSGYFSEDSIIIDGACESYIDGGFNDNSDKIL